MGLHIQFVFIVFVVFVYLEGQYLNKKVALDRFRVFYVPYAINNKMSLQR